MKKLKSISMKLPPDFIKELKRVAASNGVTVYEAIETWLKNRGALCPVCHHRWPTESEPKVSFATRVNPKIVEAAETKDMPSRYYSAVLQHALGYCPLCSQKIEK